MALTAIIPVVSDCFRIKEVVCFGEGAGANILARFAVSVTMVTD